MALKLNRQTVETRSVWLKKNPHYTRMDFGQVVETSMYSRVIMDALIIIRDNLFNQMTPILTELTINLPTGPYKIGTVFEGEDSLESMAANLAYKDAKPKLKLMTSGGIVKGKHTSICIDINENTKLDVAANLIKDECQTLNTYNKILVATVA